MPKTKSKPKRVRIPRIEWKGPHTHPSGATYWESPDGMLRIHRSDGASYGVTMPTIWKVWQRRNGVWHNVLESRSRKRAEKHAARVAWDIDNSEE